MWEIVAHYRKCSRPELTGRFNVLYSGHTSVQRTSKNKPVSWAKRPAIDWINVLLRYPELIYTHTGAGRDLNPQADFDYSVVGMRDP